MIQDVAPGAASPRAERAPLPVQWGRPSNDAAARGIAVFKLQLFPRDMRFFDLFEDASTKMVEAAQALIDFLDHFEDVENKAQAIKDIEHRADTVTHEIMNELRKTFIPPLE